MFRIKHVFIFLALLFLPCPLGWPQAVRMDPESLEQTRYEYALKEILKRTERLAQDLAAQSNAGKGQYSGRRNVLGQIGLDQHRAILFKNLKESLSMTLHGGVLYLKREHLDQAEQMLAEAIRTYPDNALAHLIYADLLVLNGESEAAGHAYLSFWSHIISPDRLGIHHKLLSSNDAKIITLHVRNRMFQLGLEPPSEDEFLNVLERSGATYQMLAFAQNFLNYALPLLVILGIPFFLIRRMSGYEASAPTEGMLYQIYFVILFSYLLWLAHLFFGLPSLFVSMEWEIISVLAVGILAIFGLRLYKKYRDFQEEVSDPTTKFCPHCKKSILKLSVVCPFCNRKLD